MKSSAGKYLSKTLVFALSITITALCYFHTSQASSKWDGRYNTKWNFRMGHGSVCPKALPLEIEIEVSEGSIVGALMNNGGGNSHRFCRLYHNGSLSGEVSAGGTFVEVKVDQSDDHAKTYSSYKITGKIDGDLYLVSRNGRYHPKSKFQLERLSNTHVPKSKQVIVNNKVEVSVAKDPPAKVQPQEQPVVSKQKVPTQTNINESVQSSEQVANNTTTVTSTVSVEAPPVKSSTRWKQARTPEEAQRYVDDIQASVVMFIAIAEVIEKQPATLKDRVLSVVTDEIKRLRAEKKVLEKALTQKFSTPIRPNNANLRVSSFRASDTFPKIPFYIPGTSEIGEMLVVPRVSDEGELIYQIDFLDPTSSIDKVRDTINISHDNINLIITGLGKIDKWTTVAQENNLTRRVEKSAACVPEGVCEKKKRGVSSTEVVFQVYEDGSTSGKLQRNKGKFSVGYNFSVESSILLSAYLMYMADVGAKEFNIGVMSDEEVEDLFE